MLRIVVNNNGLVRRNRSPRHYEFWQLWHVWRITMPRRAINGQLVWGTVLRRYDGDRWVYKKYTEDAE
jgi:hypothetical protein